MVWLKQCYLFQLKNPTFIFISLGGCAESLIIFGVSAFSFKYLAEMYNMGFDTAGILLGTQQFLTLVIFMLIVQCGSLKHIFKI